MKKWILKPDKYLKDDEIKRLRKFCQDRAELDLSRGRKQGVKDWMIIDLGLSAGLRASEIANLKVKNLFIGYGEESIFIEKSKGEKSRNVFIDKKLKQHLKNYLDFKMKTGEDDAEYMLISERKAKYTLNGIQRRFKRVMELAGLPKHYSIHCLRHTFATQLLKVTKNLRMIQKQLGHSSISTVTVYADVMEEEIKKGMDSLYEYEKQSI